MYCKNWRDRKIYITQSNPAPHLIEPHQLVGTNTGRSKPRHLSQDLSCHQIMKTPHLPQNVGGDNSQLRPEDKHIFNHHHTKPPRGSSVIPIPKKQTGELAPFPTHSLEVLGHLSPVDVF